MLKKLIYLQLNIGEMTSKTAKTGCIGGRGRHDVPASRHYASSGDTFRHVRIWIGHHQ